MAKKESKAHKIAAILSQFTHEKLSVSKIARSTGAKEDQVRRVARMNPGQCLVLDAETIQIIGEGGVSTKTEHNLLIEPQPVSFTAESHARPKRSSTGKAALQNNRGTT